MFRQALPSLLLCTIAALPGASPWAEERAAARDQRARIVESGLKDLSAANEAAIARQRVDPVPSTDSLGAPRVRLQPPPEPDADALVREDIQSSLHRLHRETTGIRTGDDRQAIVEDTLNRQGEQIEGSGSRP